MVIGDGIVTAGNDSVSGVENGLARAGGVPGGDNLFERRFCAAQVPCLPRYHRRTNVRDDSAPSLDVIRHLAFANNDVGVPTLGVAEYHRISARDHDLGGI